MTEETEETTWRPNATAFTIGRYSDATLPGGFYYSVTWENSYGEIDLDTKDETPEDGDEEFESLDHALTFGEALLASYDLLRAEADADADMFDSPDEDEAEAGI